MEAPFKRLALALTVSPRSRALLREAVRLKNLYQAELIVVHAGKAPAGDEELLRTLVRESGLSESTLSIIRRGGDPAENILRKAREDGTDLLIAGALEKENMLRYYLGSVARTLMRKSDCSMLFFTKPLEQPSGFRTIYTLIEYSTAGEHTVRVAHAVTLFEKAHELHLLRDFYIPGLTTVSEDARSAEAGRELRSRTQTEERDMMEMFVRALDLKGVKCSMTSLFGKEGWETAAYVREHAADLYVVTGPERKPKLLDRLFPRSLEFLFERLPSNVLLVRDRP